MSRDTLELMEVTREDAGIYQCLVDNGGSPITQEQKVVIIGMMMMIQDITNQCLFSNKY